MKHLILAALLILPTSASAKDVTVTFNDAEQADLGQLLDQAVRGGGLEAASKAMNIIYKIQAAAKDSQPVQPSSPTFRATPDKK